VIAGCAVSDVNSRSAAKVSEGPVTFLRALKCGDLT